VALPADSAQADLQQGTASYRLSDFAVQDQLSLPNAMGGDKPAVPSTVSFDIRFSGVTNRTTARDEQQQFTLDYQVLSATMAWSAKQDGFSFMSDPASTSKSLVAVIGSERNGVFFSTPAAAAPPAPAPAPAAPAVAPAVQPVATAPAAAPVPRTAPAQLPKTGELFGLPLGLVPMGAAALLGGLLLRRRPHPHSPRLRPSAEERPHDQAQADQEDHDDYGAVEQALINAVLDDKAQSDAHADAGHRQRR